MSCENDDITILMAFNKGHSAAWKNETSSPPCRCTDCPTNQNYRRGHHAGVIARFYYDKGFEAGKASNSWKPRKVEIREIPTSRR